MADRPAGFRRPLDTIIAGCALVVLSPLILILSGLIFIFMGRPVFFLQERVGKNQVPFRILKFRTMVIGAQQQHTELMRARIATDGSFLVKNERDPRSTALGLLLRKFRLDELPQLLNVLRGEMALVGPRPMLPEEVALLPKYGLARFNVAPGITGLAQIGGSGHLSVEDYLRKDLELAQEKLSPRVYLRVLLSTPAAVLRGDG